MQKRIKVVRSVVILMIPILLLLFGYMLRAQAAYHNQPLAEGRLGEVFPGDRMEAVPGDGMPLYPGDEKWEASVTPTNQGLDGGVTAIAISGNNVYVGGNFTHANNQTVNHIARWDGSQWHPLDNGISGTIQALVVNGSDLYAGGSMTSAGGQNVSAIAHWDGSQWAGMGDGFDGSVTALTISGSDVYAGVQYSFGGPTTYGVFRWDGSQWHSVGGELNGAIRALAVNGNELYAGGEFALAGGQTVNHIARWDGSVWYPLGSGVSGFFSNTSVFALAVSGNDLFVGGNFMTAGGQPVDGIARWDGSAWQPLPLSRALSSGGYIYVHSLAVSGGNLFVGGSMYQFPTSDPDPQYYTGNGIVRWDGSKWWNLGSGTPGTVFSVGIVGENQIYAGGYFLHAGNKPSPYLAIWHEVPEITNSSSSGAPGSTFTLTGRYFPANSPVTVLINGASLSQTEQIAVASSLTTDVYGVVKVNIATGAHAIPGTYQVTFQANGATSGAVDYQLISGQPVQTGDGTSSTVLVPESLTPTEYTHLFLPLTIR